MAEIKTLINLVELKDLILKFLESKDFLRDIKQQCSVHLENNRKKKVISPIIFTLKINYHEVQKESLLNFITREIDYFLETVHEIVHSLVKSYLEQQSGNSSLINISSDEIICNFQFFDLPLELYKFSLRVNHINCSLSTFRCIIQRTDPVVKYIRQSTWKCLSCYNSLSIIVRNRTVTHKAPKCKQCLKPCIELPENRVTSEFCSAFVFEADSILNYREYLSINTLELRLFDDLCQELKIGQEYLVIGKYEVLNSFYNVYSLLLI
ncbi:hypothetical protein ACKWTF_008312 [Chironomus riparius]